MTAYVTGQSFTFIAAGVNTGAATININSIGSKAITKNGTTALVAGDIPSGAAVKVVYDGTRFQLINPPTTAVNTFSGGTTGLTPSTATSGAVTLAGTLAVVNGGTGSTSFTQNAIIVGDGTNVPTGVLPSTNGNLLTSTVGATVTAGSFVVGTQYTILTVGTTSFTAIGASANTVGIVFTATGVGSGDGTATTNVWTSATPATPAKLSTATGSAPSYSARAWVNFNGATIINTAATWSRSGTTVTVTLTAHGYQTGNRVGFDRNSGGAVSDGMYVITGATLNTFTFTASTSATDTGGCNLRTATILGSANIFNVAYDNTGVYGINFTTAMPSANYACTANCNSPSGVGQAAVMISRRNSEIAAPTAQSQVIYTSTDAGNVFDAEYVNAVIFA
jgi:hypothetical protein